MTKEMPGDWGIEIDGVPVTRKEYQEWLAQVNTQRYLDLCQTCNTCGHIRFQRVLYFTRADWRLSVRKWLAIAQCAVFIVTHWSCRQCRFDKKIGRNL